MKIVHVNNVDIHGSRFNGHDLQLALNKQGISCKQFVMEKLGDDDNTLLLARDEEEPFLREYCKSLESELSVHSMLFPYGWRLLQHKAFTQADVAHYHLLHNSFFSFAMLRDLTASKPSALTLHDPWLFTGHCVHPFECTKWEDEQCRDCENLDRYFPLKADTASINWQLKRDVFSDIEIDLVVASKWMLDLARRSPITAHHRIHHIPFGIDTSVYCERRDKLAIRERLGIPKEHIVLSFRTTPPNWKNLSFIIEMLQILPEALPITLLTCGFSAINQSRYPSVDIGWIGDDNQMADFYAATDIFLMPSIAESFGMMAIEAMSAGLPVIVMEGTALPNVTFAPECGIAVQSMNVAQFAEAVVKLIKNPEERQQRGALGRKLSLANYRVEDYIRRHLELYEELLSRSKYGGRVNYA